MKGQWILVSAVILAAGVLSGQEITKPQVGSVTGVPSDPPLSQPTCKETRFGYLDSKLTEAEIGKFVDSNLRKGYVLTIYPQSKSGVFVNMECPASTAPAHP